MRKTILLLVCMVMVVSCTTTTTTQVEQKPKSISDKPQLNVLVDDKVYEQYGVPKTMSMIKVSDIENYDELKDNVVIVNASSVNLENVTLACTGLFLQKNWGFFLMTGIPYADTRVNNFEAPVVFLECDAIQSNKKKKFAPDKGIKIKNMKYLVVSVDEPEDANVVVSYVEVSHHDLYLYITDRP